MQLNLGQTTNNPFEVPEGYYIGTFFRYRPAKKPFCRCALDQQMRFDFSLVDSDGHDEGYIGSATLCTTRRCQQQFHGVRFFLEHWLGDRFYDFLDSDGNIELDRLLHRKADVQIVEVSTAKHAQPYSKLEKALPPGTLIED